MKGSMAILAVGFVIAIVLSAAITVADDSAQQGISAESREVNRVSSSQENWENFTVYVDAENTTYSAYVNMFNATATAIVPRAVEYPNDFSISLLLTVELSANATRFLAEVWDISFLDANYGSVAWGYHMLADDQKAMTVNGTSVGGTGVGAWNLTVNFDGFYCSIPQQTNWLSFTSEAKAHLNIELTCNVGLSVSITDKSGTFLYYPNYTRIPTFDLVNENTTFYKFAYPAGAWLGYGTSVLLAIASLSSFVAIKAKKTGKRWRNKLTGSVLQIPKRNLKTPDRSSESQVD